MLQHAECTIMDQIHNRENANLSWNAPTLGLQGELQWKCKTKLRFAQIMEQVH